VRSGQSTAVRWGAATVNEVATRVALFLFLSLVLNSGCSHPTDKAITKFADSASALTSIISSAVDLGTELDGKTKATVAGTAFASGSWPKFPPQAGTFFDKQTKEDWAVRVAFLKAVSAYAKALAEVNDPSLVKSVTDTTQSLSVALSDFVAAESTAAGTTNRSQRIQLIGGIIADAVGFATELYSGARMRDVMSRAQPVLDRARNILKPDLADMTAAINTATNIYQRTVIDKLQMYADDSKLSRAERYDLYIAASNEMASLRQRVQVLRDAGDAIDAMVEAHRGLMQNSDDQRALVAFLSVVQSMADKVKKLRALDKANQ
jgi:hypothetical protein